MKILVIKATNFLGYRELYLDLRKHKGITIIEGLNGTGKTAIFEAVNWGLYGNLLRKVPKDHAMFEKANGDRLPCTVETMVELDNGLVVTVDRKRTSSGPSLRLTGKGIKEAVAGTSGGAQDQLEALLGMDQRLFTSTVLFGGTTLSSFCRMQPADRAETMERLLGVSYYLDARERVTKRREVVHESHRSAKLRVENLDQSINETRATLKVERKYAQEYRYACDREVFEHHEALNGTQERVDEMFEQLAALDEAASEAEKKRERARRQWTKKRKEAVAAMKRVTKEKVKPIQKEIALREAAVEQHEEHLESMKSGQHPDVCPYCKRAWPQDGPPPDPYHHEKLIKDGKAALAKLRSQLRRAEQMAADHRAVSVVEFVPPPDTNVAPQREKLVAAVARADAEIRSHIQSIAEARERREKNPHKATMRRMKGKLSREEQELRELQASSEGFVKEKAILDYWATGFSRHGLPSMLLDEAVPILNQAAITYGKILTDGEFSISFDPAVEKGSSTHFSVQVENVRGASSYWGSSKGEQARIDLCILLAIRELNRIHSGAQAEQLFVDEVFDGMDAIGLERVIPLLRKGLEGISSFVISHDPILKGAADQAIMVTKKGRQSELRV